MKKRAIKSWPSVVVPKERVPAEIADAIGLNELVDLYVMEERLI